MENTMITKFNEYDKVMELLCQSNNAHQKILEFLTPAVADIKENIKEEISNQLKDENVFNKAQLKEDVVAEVSGSFDNKIKEAINEKGLNRLEIKELTDARNRRFRLLLGDSKSDKYILLISFYQGAMVKKYRTKFECNAYGDVRADRKIEALNYINTFDVDNGYYNWAINRLHDQYRDGEIESIKKKNAYERFFGIRG